MYKVEDVKKMIGGVSDDKLNSAVSKGALKLSDDQINTVSFVFWLCYLAERDIGFVISESWKKLAEMFGVEAIKPAKKFLTEYVFGKDKEKDIENLDFLTEKIRVYQGCHGSNNVTKILWEINRLRNDVSHGRIDALIYAERSLLLREVKEKLLIDYMEAVNNPDHSKPTFRDDLKLDLGYTEEIKKILLNF